MSLEIWPGSRLSLEGVESHGGFSTAPDPFVLAFLLLSMFAIVILFSRLLTAITASASLYRSSYGTHETLENNTLCNAIKLILPLLVPIYAFSLWKVGFGASYWHAFLAVVAVLVFRKLVYLLMSWLSSQGEAFGNLEKLSYGTAIPMMLLSMLSLPLLQLIPDFPMRVVRIYFIVLFVSSLIVYVRRSFDIISSTGFSSFFWVLYLCTLEILPICVVANIMIYGH